MLPGIACPGSNPGKDVNLYTFLLYCFSLSYIFSTLLLKLRQIVLKFIKYSFYQDALWQYVYALNVIESNSL